jgi:hypothetical protein
MSNFLDGANAIWKALDEMAAKDPDAYSAFIQAQLSDPPELFRPKEVKKCTSPRKDDDTLSKRISALSIVSKVKAELFNMHTC